MRLSELGCKGSSRVGVLGAATAAFFLGLLPAAAPARGDARAAGAPAGAVPTLAALGLAPTTTGRPVPTGASAPRTLVAADDDPPRQPPIPRSDPRAEQAAAEKRRKEELDAQPVYKRWWFWALAAAVVGGTAALAVATVGGGGSTSPAKGCVMGATACFGDGRR